MIAIPLFADQLYNAAIVKKKQIGVYLDIKTITKEKVYRALVQVLTDERSVDSMNSARSMPMCLGLSGRLASESVPWS